MADNLSITIGADTSKARHEMELLNAEMRKTQKEIKATSDAAVKGDPKAVQNLKALTAAYDGMAKKVVTFKKEIAEANKETNKFHKEHAHGFYLVENSVQSLNGAFMALGHNLAGARAGIVGFVVAIGLEKIKEQIDEVSNRLVELRKAAGEIGVRPIALQAVQEVARAAGRDADEATKLMQGLGTVIEENRQKFAQPVIGGAGLPTVLSAGGTAGTPTPGRILFPGATQGAVRVGRGGVPGLTDPTQALADLDTSRFGKDAKGTEQAILAVLKRVQELHKTMTSLDFNIFAKARFGMSGEALIKLADVTIPQTEAKIKELAETSRGATDATIANNERLIASQAKLKDAFDEAMSGIAKATQPAQVAINEFVTLWIEDNIKLFQTWSSFWDSIVNVVTNAANSIKSVLSGISSAVSSAVSTAGQAISDAAQQGAIPGLAGGGYVRGPGTGTSDSIMARLSAGEFVVNAARVRQLGLGFMQQLNGFADGGFVGKFPRFAEGGLVGAAAGGGTPVHLHLDGASYAMHAEAGVAEALVVAARRQQMRSAGVRPSWYGGRAGA